MISSCQIKLDDSVQKYTFLFCFSFSGSEKIKLFWFFQGWHFCVGKKPNVLNVRGAFSVCRTTMFSVIQSYTIFLCSGNIV